MPQPSKIKTKSQKKSKKLVDEYCTFIVEVVDWELPYSFSINLSSKYDSSTYSEHLHLGVKGVLREPKKFNGKEITLTFIGKRDLVPGIEDQTSSYKPTRIGTVTIWGESRDYIGSLPYDSVPMIASMLETKSLRYIQLHGKSPYRGNAATTSIHFFRDYNPDDY